MLLRARAYRLCVCLPTNFYTKKALQMDLESPLTPSECFGIVYHLSAPQGPQVVPSQAPRPAKVLCLAFFMRLSFVDLLYSVQIVDTLFQLKRNFVRNKNADINI